MGDNSTFLPTHLTFPLGPAYPSFQEPSMLCISSGEDRMAFHVFLFLLLCFLMLSPLVAFSPFFAPSRPSLLKSWSSASRDPSSPETSLPARLPRLLPFSPVSAGAGPSPPPVRPWSEVKRRRGAPKRIDTHGFACPNHQCPYFGITDAHIHALVGDGKHGQAERIQTFRCQACRTTFSA